MNINLDRFWKYISKWTVGRLIALLVLLYMIFCCRELACILGRDTIFALILLAVLLECFQLSLDKLDGVAKRTANPCNGAQLESNNREPKKNEQRNMDTQMRYFFGSALVLSLIGIILTGAVFLCGWPLQMTR